MMIFYERIRTRVNTIKPSGLITACAALSVFGHVAVASTLTIWLSTSAKKTETSDIISVSIVTAFNKELPSSFGETSLKESKPLFSKQQKKETIIENFEPRKIAGVTENKNVLRKENRISTKGSITSSRVSDRRIYSLALPSRKPQPIVKSIKLQSQSETIIQTQIDYDKITPARNPVKYNSVTTHTNAAQTTYNKIKGGKTPGKHEKIKSNKDNSLKLIYNPAPRYPRIARKEGKEGLVTINAIISSKGLVTTASIKKSSGFPILDRAALKAVRKWVFKPKLKFNGNSNSSVDVPIQFKLTKS